ncbi:GNAT family N-acetyltransferase [Solihabitans fulvus]|uniref:GNAT family N-acetyltransferase n=1 Tax=Solihabitans fulvus TaxID=1892852 RepID=A0A5B2WMH9_9PSEU|nr:GNAT family N-acetyltransferase [Solihabitans fulvus]KAA2252184.1 GNAT family N-acetyltransferase [Solihabitans fulvus]
MSRPAIITTVHRDVDEFAADYLRMVPNPPLHESVRWLRYCDRRSRGGMRYVAARDTGGALIGLAALRATADRSGASPNYDVADLVWPWPLEPPVPRNLLYPQLFGAVSGARCLLTARDNGVLESIADAADALAGDGVLSFAGLADLGLARRLAGLLRNSEVGLVGAETVLDVTWTDFDGYLATLGRNARTSIRRERRQYLAGGLRTRVVEGTAALDECTARLQVQLAAKYRTTASTEAVLADYADIAATMADRMVVFLAERAGAPVGMCVCLRDNGTLHIRNVAFDYAATRADFVYFNVMCYEPLLWGLCNGISRFCFGNGAAEAKRRRGCRLDPLYGVVRWPGSLAAACGGSLAHRTRLARAELGLAEPEAASASASDRARTPVPAT